MKDKHTCGQKMARNGPTMVIYKGTFVSNQSLNGKMRIPNYTMQYRNRSRGWINIFRKGCFLSIYTSMTGFHKIFNYDKGPSQKSPVFKHRNYVFYTIFWKRHLFPFHLPMKHIIEATFLVNYHTTYS